MMNIISLVFVFAVVIAWAISSSKVKSNFQKTLSEKDAAISSRDEIIANKDEQIAQANERLQLQKEEIIRKESDIKTAQQLRENDSKLHKEALEQLKESQDKALEDARKTLALENEKALRRQEEILQEKAAENMKNITGGLDKSIKDMKDSFDAQKVAYAEATSSIKTKVEETATHIMQTAQTVGTHADNLANALKGKNKMQGIFGETVLENLLQAEGLRPGIDYEKEYWLRDKKGNLIVNEDTSKKMRPDYVLHFPDETDVLLDSKVSLTALSDYFAAETQEQRDDAAARNLESVWNHVKELSTKEYQKYIKGRKTLEYVIMFIPNYGAYQLAKQSEPDLFAKAFRDHKVLITTDETLLPFVKLVSTAWVQKAQLENVAEIVKKAQQVVDRVGLFCKENEKLGRALTSAVDVYNTNTARLTTSKQSIVGAAAEIVNLGVKSSKSDVVSLESLTTE